MTPYGPSTKMSSKRSRSRYPIRPRALLARCQRMSSCACGCVAQGPARRRSPPCRRLEGDRAHAAGSCTCSCAPYWRLNHLFMCSTQDQERPRQLCRGTAGVSTPESHQGDAPINPLGHEVCPAADQRARDWLHQGSRKAWLPGGVVVRSTMPLQWSRTCAAVVLCVRASNGFGMHMACRGSRRPRSPRACCS